MNIEEHIENMEKMFGTLPDYNHHPRQFSYLVKLYKFYTEREENKKSLDKVE